MSDWIDRERELRRSGRGNAMTQSQHAEVNSRYPGLTLEYCSRCGDPTGKADHHDVPLCDECRHEREGDE